jgi:hypothetical protein
VRFFLGLVGAAAALAFAACGGGGGSGGSGGQGGGSDGGLCANAPPCVVALYNLSQTCPATGACTTQSQNAQGIIPTCFANGVKVYTDYAHGIIRQTKPDGISDCLFETYVGSASEPGTLELTFKDASGATIATATSSSAGVVFNCDGQSYNPAVECPGSGGGEPTCSLGSCQ